ncbi:hypothetical protein JXA02_11140 [candidate division KSB1 bacterium]|nr:hypothetical protein [candidate division KSB1 bacterium]
MKLVFYISGHGYGHAVRDIEIIKSLVKIHAEAEIHFRTRAPQWLFAPLLGKRIFYHERELDFGVVQKNSFSADKKATFQRYAALVDQKENLIDRELAFLHSVQPDIILSDITPFAFDAAEAYGKKAVAIGNFSWDWIYTPYLDKFPDYAWVVEDIRSSYVKADRLWRIPFYGDMSAFPSIEDVPLVGRKAQLPAQVVRERLGMAQKGAQKYVLLGLRMSDLAGVEWRGIEKMPLTFVAVSRDIRITNCLHVEEASLPFEDVLHACDAVLSKPGYSIVAEVLVNRTPIVYIPRSDFVEDAYLTAGLAHYAVCEELSQPNFYAGNWRGAFERLFAKPPVWQEIRHDGAEVIAANILRHVN